MSKPQAIPVVQAIPVGQPGSAPMASAGMGTGAQQFGAQQFGGGAQFGGHGNVKYGAPTADDLEMGGKMVGSDCEFVHEAGLIIRQGFIRKVFGVLAAQLVLTFGLCAAFTYEDSLFEYVQDNTWIFYGSFVGSFVTLFSLVCCIQNARTYPTNYMLLGLFTLFEGVLLGCVSAQYDPDIVMQAMGMTAGVTIGLMLFACQTKYDFTGMHGYAFGALITLIMWGWFGWLFCFSKTSCKTVNTIYCLMGVLVFCFYIIYDTQLIVGGAHKKYQYGLDDYVFAALSLYLDIINLFLFILSLLGDR